MWRADTEVVSSCPSRAFMGSVYGPIGPKKKELAAKPRGAAMQPVREWLGSLGLSEYADSFDRNRIDLSVLPELTDQDLKELGSRAR